MTELQIDYFLSVAETLNITESARLLFVSPPAVSRHIRDLEEELGFPLLTRSTRGVKLLPEGQRLREILLSHRQKLTGLKREARARLSEKKQLLRIGIASDWMPFPVLQALRDSMPAAAPGLQILPCSTDLFRLSQLLRDDQADLLLSMLAPNSTQLQGFSYQYLCPLRRVLLFSPSLFFGEEATIQKLAAFPLLIAPKYVLENSLSLCVSHGISPEIHVFETMNSVLQAVALGEGFCITDEWCWAAQSPQFGRLDLPDRITACMIWRADDPSPCPQSVAQAVASALQR